MSPRSSSVRHAETDGVRLALGHCRVGLLGRVVATGTVVLRRLLGSGLRLSLPVEFLRRLERAICRAVRQQSIAVFPVDLGPLALAVRSRGTTDIRALVPLQTNPAQRVEDHLLAAGDETCAVGVLDAQHELAATLLCKNVVQQADVGCSNVRIACGRRRNANADRRVCLAVLCVCFAAHFQYRCYQLDPD
jgi:hypothetical protein